MWNTQAESVYSIRMNINSTIINCMNAFGGIIINCDFDDKKKIIFPNLIFIPDLRFPDIRFLVMKSLRR